MLIIHLQLTFPFHLPILLVHLPLPLPSQPTDLWLHLQLVAPLWAPVSLPARDNCPPALQFSLLFHSLCAAFLSRFHFHYICRYTSCLAIIIYTAAILYIKMLCSVKKRAAKMRRGSRSVVQSAVPGRVVGLSAERKMPTSPMLQQQMLLLLWCMTATAACPKMPVAVWH